MDRKYWYILIILVFGLYSCDNLIVKKGNREDIIEKKWSELDKNEVEEPPLFEACKYKVREELEKCFHQIITKHIQEDLMEHTFTVTKSINDTIWIPLLITKDGEILLEEYSLPKMIISQLPDFKDILEESIANLPSVEPAHTRSTPTSARYKLPLVIKIE